MNQTRKPCPYHPIELDCEKLTDTKYHCQNCGWNPEVARKRKNKIRNDIRMNGPSHTVFVYCEGGSMA